MMTTLRCVVILSSAWKSYEIRRRNSTNLGGTMTTTVSGCRSHLVAAAPRGEISAGVNGMG